MEKGKSELMTLILSVSLPPILVQFTPSKTTAYLIFFPLIILCYILLKREERLEVRKDGIQNNEKAWNKKKERVVGNFGKVTIVKTKSTTKKRRT